MKVLAVIFCLFISVHVLAQTKDTTKVVFRDAINKSTDPLYIENGERIQSLNNVKPDSILEASILKDSAATSVYGIRGANGVVIITTRVFAVKQYQTKLSGFSKKYKSYVYSAKYEDSNILYVVNGIPVQGKSDDIIRKLYDLKVSNIKSVEFNEKGVKEEGMATKPLVNITTK